MDGRVTAWCARKPATAGHADPTTPTTSRQEGANCCCLPLNHPSGARMPMRALWHASDSTSSTCTHHPPPDNHAGSCPNSPLPHNHGLRLPHQPPATQPRWDETPASAPASPGAQPCTRAPAPQPWTGGRSNLGHLAQQPLAPLSILTRSHHRTCATHHITTSSQEVVQTPPDTRPGNDVAAPVAPRPHSKETQTQAC